MTKLEGKTAVITGAAGGIGAATARLFSSEGANVVLVDREQEAVDALRRELASSAVLSIAADVSSPEDTEHYVEQAVSRFGKLDILFANAGVEGRVCPIFEYPINDFDRLMAVNVRGVWLAIRAAARRFQRNPGGSILVTSSVAGLIGSPGLSAYVASKHAVLGIMKAAALELAPFGVRVNSINPGPIENRMMRSIEAQASPQAPEQVKAGFESKVALQRYGTNEEIAKLALFLASDDSSYCTGSVFVADGGFTAS
jgi:NAD(P)-dependent dehydrogenase (short-subunit alcohol dehydrogenase family)